eukprot:scaffold232119_cov19-Tisochrysis_lutea.AAC.1
MQGDQWWQAMLFYFAVSRAAGHALFSCCCAKASVVAGNALFFCSFKASTAAGHALFSFCCARCTGGSRQCTFFLQCQGINGSRQCIFPFCSAKASVAAGNAGVGPRGALAPADAVTAAVLSDFAPETLQPHLPVQ